MTTLLLRQSIVDRQGRAVARHLRGVDVTGAGVSGASSAPDPCLADLAAIDPSTVPGSGPAVLHLPASALTAIDAALAAGDEQPLGTAGPQAFEIAADDAPTIPMLNAIEHLRGQGHTLVLADGRATTQWRNYADRFDIFSVDFAAHRGPAWRKLVETNFVGPADTDRLEASGWADAPRVLCHAIGDQTSHGSATDLGYEAFQGTWFIEATPATRGVSVRRTAAIELLRELRRNNFDAKQLEQILQTDASLSRQLLVQLNSVATGVRNEVRSLRQAIVMVGEDPFRRWATMATVASVADGKGEAILITALHRARFCELLAEWATQPAPGRPIGPTRAALAANPDTAFLAGLFSLLDVFCDVSMGEVLEDMPLDRDIRLALAGRPNHLRTALDLTAALERGDWNGLADAAAGLGFALDEVAACHAAAEAWVADVLNRQDPTEAN